MTERCLHPQAVEVRLSTGELVGCLCTHPPCLEQLPPGYIDAQLDRAWRSAHCQHTELIEVTDLGQAEPDYICARCGGFFTEDDIVIIAISNGRRHA
jgi:hypothetical protein